MVTGAPLRDEIWLVSLDPTQGSEMQKTRPCLVISPDEMNQHLRTVLIAPMTCLSGYLEGLEEGGGGGGPGSGPL